MSYSKVLILILNWNGWRDTIECLESVQRLDYPNYRVMVLDNQSSDQSIDKIKEWAAGSLSCESNFLTYDAMRKPVQYIEYDRQTAEHGGGAEQEALLDKLPPEKGMVLVHTGGNLGFAGGNNVGLRYALAKGEYEYVWLLNNDTVVMPDALKHMVNRMIEDPKAGMCGSTLLYYYDPEVVQALGGAKYNKWFATSLHLGNCTLRAQTVIEKRLKSNWIMWWEPHY